MSVSLCPIWAQSVKPAGGIVDNRAMTLDEFRASISDAHPPTLPPLLSAMWHDAHGDWTRAHAITQEIETAAAAWVHAYLHRKEGDAANAAYWYRRAAQPVAHDSLESEWTRIVTALLA
jgi:hypothetical protein